MKTLDVLTDMYHTALDKSDNQQCARVLEMMIDLLNEIPDNPVVQRYLTVHEKVDSKGDSRYYYGVDKSIAIGDVVEMNTNGYVWQLVEFNADGNEYDGDPDFDEFIFVRLHDMERASVSAHELSEMIKNNLTRPDKPL